MTRLDEAAVTISLRVVGLHRHRIVAKRAHHGRMRPDNTVADIVVDDYPAQRRSLRIAVVTETYPPEVNGVARTIASVVEGLRAHNHDLQLIRPGQKKGERAIDGESFHEVLMRGLPIPRYPQLRMGLTSKRTLVKLWSTQRPDIVHIATEGPMGWSALQAAAHLKIPLCSDFRTNFHAYSKHRSEEHTSELQSH